MPRDDLSAAQARRIAVAAQGLDTVDNPGRVDIRHVRRSIQKIGLLQLDFVNVLIPAHYLIVYSRIGRYDLACFRRSVYGRGEFTEQWAHEASIVPVSTWPLLEHRRRAFRPWSNSPLTKLRNKNKYLSDIIDLITEKGPVTSQDLPPVNGPKRKVGDWHRSVPRWALEYHFGFGRIAVRDRLANFQRVYDLPERLIDDAYRNRQIDDDDARRELLRIAACACGIATLPDLADYFRMSARDARPRVAELVASGDLEEVRVEGWNDVAYLAAGSRIPRDINRSTLLSPFDPLVWFRPRAKRLFDFHYKIEIYVPEAKRRWGYYVLPFLMADRLVARVDLKADRKNGLLLVRAAHLETGADESTVANSLAEELDRLAAWLGLVGIKVGQKGGLSRPLRKAVASVAISDASTRQ